MTGLHSAKTCKSHTIHPTEGMYNIPPKEGIVRPQIRMGQEEPPNGRLDTNVSKPSYPTRWLFQLVALAALVSVTGCFFIEILVDIINAKIT